MAQNSKFYLEVKIITDFEFKQVLVIFLGNFEELFQANEGAFWLIFPRVLNNVLTIFMHCFFKLSLRFEILNKIA